jgi:SAM-dependent methyltransferase
MIKLIDLLKETNNERATKSTSLNKLLDYLDKNNAPVNINSKIINKYGRLKINSNKIYDFGGADNPIPNSIVVDIEKPDGDNKFIKQDLEDEFNLPPKDYINLSSVIHFINNKNNLVKSINNSLKPGGILIIKTSLNQIWKILPYLSDYTPLEAQIDKEEILSSEDNPDVVSIVFKK